MRARGARCAVGFLCYVVVSQFSGSPKVGGRACTPPQAFWGSNPPGRSRTAAGGLQPDAPCLSPQIGHIEGQPERKGVFPVSFVHILSD